MIGAIKRNANKVTCALHENGEKPYIGVGSAPQRKLYSNPLSPTLVLSPTNTMSYVWERVVCWNLRAELHGL